MNKKFLLLFMVVGLVAVLAGCTEFNKDITPESKGIWNQYIVYPLSWVIIKVAKIFNNSYGLSIIVVTILIRLIILPLMITQLRSSKAMQAIQPELTKLKEKYASKDAVTQQKLQKETMALFQKYKINPAAGCLPIFIQMPILIGFYHAINRTPEIRESAFLWFDLGQVDYILPVIAGITTFLQQKLMMSGNAYNNPQMKMQMNMMLWIMPIMIVFFGFKLPSALPLYWIVGNIFMIVQSYFIKGPKIESQPAVNQKAKGDKK
ncbi:YidC family membrane integrase SpoIIIJ [Bacillus ginsengihumi]|uniref:Membrane protein insertase YidC n=1 Tax=Heyndrickxia ginsengihumi TaxID=363870 RepID=A0A6M0P341_9BACI|nr:YidC family membrane integrase SpoIIIJ [Heyndrickxia ginsengihumi]NEY18615.1 YidC family membrane integrase SpoIIIJ [Heyndrickxia ginsengihumi]